MESLVGRKAMFNPIFNGAVHYTDGTEITPPKKNVQVEDGTILGVIIDDRFSEVLITGPVELNGWAPAYLMSKQFINLLETDLSYLKDDQISN